MPESSRVRITDVQAMLRLLGEIAEIKTADSRRHHLFTGISHLVGGGKGCVMGTFEFAQGSLHPIILESKTLNGLWDSPSEQKTWLDYTRVGYYDDDPFFRYMVSRMHQTMTITRRQAVKCSAWYSAPYVQCIRRATGSDDFIHSQFFDPQTCTLHAFNIARRWNDKPFTQRARFIVELLHAELVDMHRRQARTLENEMTKTLPQRLHRVLVYLLQGKSEKETAQILGLSWYTIHSYVKDLYQHFGVNSRAELLTLWVKPDISVV